MELRAWLNLDKGSEITHQVGAEQGDRVREIVNHDFSEMDSEMLVVSNFVPSYLEKQGVRFITDLELYRWIENAEEIFYKYLH